MIHDRTFATMRLWSLWELIQFIAPDWLRVYTYFSSLRILLPPAPDKQVEKIEELLGNVRFLGQHCDELGLPMTEMLAREIVETVVSPADTDWHHFCALLDRLADRFHDELSLRMIVALPTECASYYKNDAIFGEKVRNAFPSAMYDADEARLSIAFERSTACVFHLMRVMEVGIRSLARCLAIPDPIKPAERNWGIMLRRIRDAIDTKWPSTANRIQGDGALFDSIFASLDAVKNPWRNGTMHVEKKYTREEAVHIFNNVVMFMRELAQRMDENGNPPA